MILYFDSDSIRAQVHKDLLQQRFPDELVECFTSLDVRLIDASGPWEKAVIFLRLDVADQKTAEHWLAALRSRHGEAKLIAILPQGAPLLEWVLEWSPDEVVMEPIDVHSISTAVES